MRASIPLKTNVIAIVRRKAKTEPDVPSHTPIMTAGNISAASIASICDIILQMIL